MSLRSRGPWCEASRGRAPPLVPQHMTGSAWSHWWKVSNVCSHWPLGEHTRFDQNVEQRLTRDAVGIEPLAGVGERQRQPRCIKKLILNRGDQGLQTGPRGFHRSLSFQIDRSARRIEQASCRARPSVLINVAVHQGVQSNPEINPQSAAPTAAATLGISTARAGSSATFITPSR